MIQKWLYRILSMIVFMALFLVDIVVVAPFATNEIVASALVFVFYLYLIYLISFRKVFQEGFVLSNKKGYHYNGNTVEEDIAKENVSDAFDHSKIANFSDDIVGVLGWKGTGLCLIALIVGFGILKILYG